MDDFTNFSKEQINPFQGSAHDLEVDFESADVLVDDFVDSGLRLNDYDSNLLSEGAYKNLDNEIFKLEYKIGRLEKKIRALDSQFESYNALGDTEKVQFLLLKKSQCQVELEKLYTLYRSQSLPGDLSERIINLVLFLPRKLVLLSKFFAQKFSYRIFSKMKGNSKANFQDALLMLENINKNVDELVSFRAPYGESAERYDQLLKYLTKANQIQSQISKITKK